MSFLDVNLQDTPELEALAEGEYKVQINRVEEGESQTGSGKYLLFRLEVPSEPTSKDITDVIMLDDPSQSEKTNIKRLNRLKRALDAFGYDYSDGVNTEDLEGLEAWAYLTVEEDPKYGEQNRVSRYVEGQ